jgi:diacylglycerol kinase (ATP)
MMTDKPTDQLEEPRKLKFESLDWVDKFAVAGRGLNVAMTQEKSFLGHFLATAVVIVAGFVLGITKTEWLIVVLCIMSGLSTELLNTAIERLAKAITQETNPHIRDALDIASAAVLIISLGAVVLGSMVFLPKIGRLIFGPS